MAKLSLLNERASPQDIKGAVKFHYPSVERPDPTVLPLGNFTHPRTHNNLMAGINLDMMTPGEIERLKKTQKSILNKSDLPDRYWTARRINPDAMERAYRTYDLDKVDGVVPAKATAKAAIDKPSSKPAVDTTSSFAPDQWAAAEPEFSEPVEPVPTTPPVAELPMINQGFVDNQPRNLQGAPQQVAQQPAPPPQAAAQPAAPAPAAPVPELGSSSVQSQIPAVTPDTPNAIDGTSQIHSSPALSQKPVQQPVASNTTPPAANADHDDALERELDQLFSGGGDDQWDKTQSNVAQPTSGTAPTAKPKTGPRAF